MNQQPSSTPQSYAQRIQALTRQDPRHVEAFMRLEHSTLDGMSREQFAAEVEICAACVVEAGSAGAERVAKSMGL